MFWELLNRRLERNISRIGDEFGEYWEGLEEVKGNGDQQRLWGWKDKRLVS